MKIMNVSFDILTLSSPYYNEHGDKTSGFHLFINGSLIPFSKEHTPYAILAIVMLLSSTGSSLCVPFSLLSKVPQLH